MGWGAEQENGEARLFIRIQEAQLANKTSTVSCNMYMALPRRAVKCTLQCERVNHKSWARALFNGTTKKGV
jgi:hypothetical protein